jgi:hypothetical protein
VEANRKTYMNQERLKDSIRVYNNNTQIQYQAIKTETMNSTGRGAYNSVGTPIIPLDHFTLADGKETLEVPQGVTLHFKRTGMNEVSNS